MRRPFSIEARLLLPVAAALSVSLAAQTPPPPPTVPPPTPPTAIQVGAGRPMRPERPGYIAPRPGVPAAALSGMVVDSNGRAVPTVAVRVIGLSSVQTQLTDEKGRFNFAALVPGEYVVTARKYGYYDGAFGKRRAGGDPLPVALAAGQAFADMKIELFRAAVITGFVLDEASEPVVGARVVAMRRYFVNGDWQYSAAGTDSTDDQGIYRVYGLEPGEYLVSTPTTQVTGDAELPPTERVDLAYPTLFYPATRHSLLALPVQITAGEVRLAVNFQWSPVSAHAVAGRLTGPGSMDGHLIKLVPVDSREIGVGNEAALALSAPDGTFEFERVPAGEYRLEAGGAFSAPSLIGLIDPDPAAAPPLPLWGHLTVNVADEDVRNLRVTMREGVTVSGLIAAPSSPTRTASTLVRIPITIVPARPGLTRTTTPRILPDGTFTASNMIPGEYFVRIGTLPAGLHLKSVTANGQDVMDRPVDLGDADLANIVVTLTDRGTEIMGAVRDARLQTVTGAAVIVLPASSTSWTPNRTRRTRASTNGQFAIAGLPPGEYLIVAVDDVAAEGWQDERVLAQLRTLATRLSLREAESTSIQLRISVLRR